MTQIHDDFAKMAELLRRSGVADGDRLNQKDEAGDELPRVDRIVLYIDDLDRCPPERVVEYSKRCNCSWPYLCSS